MDFFDRQDRARRRTQWLVVWFGMAVVAIVLAVYAAVFLALRGARLFSSTRGMVEAVEVQTFDPQLFLIVAGSVIALVALGSLYKISTLSEGGEAVARMLGGRPIDPNTDALAERRLLNVVEEMAIASGTPVPTVYLMEREPGINAFAAGFTSGDAVIGVTQGTLDHLSRDELQGVVAHEFSHIMNGDMRLNLRLMGVVHGILLLALVGYWMVRTLRYTDRRSAGVVGAFVLVGLALVAIGWIGVFFGRLIKSGVSRQREILADSSAVQFTRNPSGLADALRKIGGAAAGSRIRSSHAEEASHLFFGNGLKPSFFGWFSTHPPLDQRIRLLDPQWDGTFPTLAPVEKASPDQAPGDRARDASPLAPGLAPSRPMGTSAGAGAASLAGATVLPPAGSLSAEGHPRDLDPAAAAARVGSLEQKMILHAQRVVAALPDPLARAVREPAEAESVIYALLLHSDQKVRERQLERISKTLGARADALLAQIGRALVLLRDTTADQRLPIVDLALPALRRLSDRQYRAFLEHVRALASGEGRLRLFEFTLQRIIARHLAPRFDGPESSRVIYYSLKGLSTECSTLLSALAYVGGDERTAEAFAAGKSRLDPSIEIELLPVERCSLVDVDQALRRLAQVAPRYKRQLIEAIVLTIAHDRRVTIEEAELLRAICDTVDSPMPPFLPGVFARSAS